MSFDSMFMGHAVHASKFSPDPSTKVGAVIALDRKLFSVGWNQFPTGVVESSERWENRAEKYPRVIHAEADALVAASRVMHKEQSLLGFEDATLYTTEFPCCSCCGLIIQYGIKRVVSQDLSSDYAERWAEQIEISKSMFSESGVELVTIPR
jgi:dCMP deaminase